jgi:hypothetical protein
MDWKKDRERLKAEIRKASKDGGFKATMLYVLISHMRGKIHMKWYKKYEGGWDGSKERWPDTRKIENIPEEIKKAYGECVEYYYKRAAIETLKDQEIWIRKHLDFYKENEEMFELANRVISDYNKREALIA